MIGARRRRQGTGGFIARFLHRAGAEVVAVAGTTEGTVVEAVAALAADGVDPKGYTDVDRLLHEQRPDVLVIASPSETHGAHLDRALAASCHVLCEKPFVWGDEDPGPRARALAEAFRAEGLHLAVVTQWPLTLDAYAALHPAYLRGPPRRFAMRLAPARAGPVMVPDAMPHALSLLQHALPSDAPTLDDLRVEIAEGGAQADVAFTYRTPRAACEAHVRLRQGEPGPKPASYAFDDRWVERRIGDDYAMSFADGDREVPLPDPLERLVRGFLVRLSSSEVPDVDPAAWPGTDLVATVARAWPASGPGAP